MYNPFTLEGKTILITGAGGGIGRATAVACAKMGATIVVTDINEVTLKETLDILHEETLKDHQMFAADLTNEEALDNLVKDVPALDGMVCNAGISKVLPIQFLNSDDMGRIVNINAFAPMYLTQNSTRRKKSAKVVRLCSLNPSVE